MYCRCPRGHSPLFFASFKPHSYVIMFILLFHSRLPVYRHGKCRRFLTACPHDFVRSVFSLQRREGVPSRAGSRVCRRELPGTVCTYALPQYRLHCTHLSLLVLFFPQNVRRPEIFFIIDKKKFCPSHR